MSGVFFWVFLPVIVVMFWILRSGFVSVCLDITYWFRGLNLRFVTLSILSSLCLLPFTGVLEHSTKTCFPFHLFILRKSWQTSELLRLPGGHTRIVMLSSLIFLSNFSWLYIYLCRHTESEARGAMVIFWSIFQQNPNRNIFSTSKLLSLVHLSL